MIHKNTRSSFLNGEGLIDPGKMPHYQNRDRIPAEDSADQSKGDREHLIPEVSQEEREGNNGTKRLQDPGPGSHA